MLGVSNRFAALASAAVFVLRRRLPTSKRRAGLSVQRRNVASRGALLRR